MTRTLFLLALWQIKNSVRASLRRPIVWVPLLLAAIALPFQMGHALFYESPLPSDTGAAILAHGDALRAIVFLTLALLAVGYVDRGLGGGAFTFDPADVAFLFPSPVPRRLLMLFKLPGVTFSLLSFVGLLAWQFRLFVWLPVHAPGLAPAGGGWTAFLAAALCVGGYLHAAVALDVAGSPKRPVAARRVFLTVVVLALFGVGWFVWRRGLIGLLTLGTNPLLNVLFLPCGRAADAVTLPLTGHRLSVAGWLSLIGWYGATFLFLISRRENFYEAAAVHSENVARVRQAYRAGDWAGARIQGKPRTGKRSFTLNFGMGAGALWAAHLAAALKRPWLNAVGPVLGAVGFVLLVAVLVPQWAVRGNHMSAYNPEAVASLKSVVQVVTGYYVFYAVTTLAVQFFRRSLARESFGRTLPVKLVDVVRADVGTRAALGSLFAVAAGGTLLLCRVPDTLWTGLGLLLLVPVGILALNFLGCRMALAYPNGADRAQTVTASMVQLFWTGVLGLCLSPFYFLPVTLHAPDAVVYLSVLSGLLAAVFTLERMTVRAAARFEPHEDRPPANARLWWADFRKGLTYPAMKKSHRPLVIILAVVALVAFAGARLGHKPKALPPRTVTARTDTLLVKVSETGTVQPVDKINVQSKVSGRLLTIPVTEGQRVHAGQLIATVDRSQLDPQIQGLQAQLTQAQARLQETEAQYQLQRAQAESSIVSARAALVQAQTHLAAVSAPARTQEVSQQAQAVSRAQIALNDALRTQKRRAALLQKGFVSQSDVDAAQVAADTAQSTLDAAQQSLSLTNAGPRPQDINDAKAAVNVARASLQSATAGRDQYPVAQATVAQARAAVQQAQTSLAQLMVQSADTRILAPAPGIVLKKYKQIGEIVQSSLTGFSDAQSLVATLGSRLEVLVGINEVDIPKVRVGAPVRVRVDALPNVSFAGRVSEVSPASTNAFSSADAGASGGSSISKFNVKVALSAYDVRLRPGMTAQADVISAKHPNAVLVPLEAVPFTTPTGMVKVLTATNGKETRTVVIGLRSDTDAEIMRGLKAGDRVIVTDLSGKDRPKIDVGGN